MKVGKTTDKLTKKKSINVKTNGGLGLDRGGILLDAATISPAKVTKFEVEAKTKIVDGAAIGGKKSIHFDFRMNVFDSLSVSWLFTIRTISLHLEHSIAMSPLLLKNSSIASTPITTSCFFTISSVMNRMLWVTVRDWIDSEFSEMILMIVHC